MTATITPGTSTEHEGLWVGSLKPTPTHSARDDPKIAARLWLRRAKANPATIDTLRAAETWSCRDTDVPFWQAVSVELFSGNGNAPAPVVTQETRAHKPTDGLSEISNPIPEPLRECRFILVGANSKRAIEPKWQTDRNYAHDDPHLLQHIAGGGNYGVMVAGGICVLDADDPHGLAETGALTGLMGTYTVRTGRDGGGAHLYFRCPELPAEKFVLTHPTTGANLGDLRGSGSPFYVVGPGSTHPDTGRPYEPVDPDAEVVSVPLETVQVLIDSLRKPEPVRAPEKPKPSVRGRSISDELGLRPEMFLMPEDPHHRDGEIEGTHPIHGSSTGNNLTISPDGTWYCRRCLSGGGALEALAVAERIIDCADAQSGCLEGHWDTIFAALKRRGYQIPETRVITPPPTTDPGTLPPAAGFIATKSGKIEPSFQLLADEFLHRFRPITWDKTVYVYIDGLYRPESGEIAELVTDSARASQYTGSVTRVIREVTTYINASSYVSEYPFDHCDDALPLANGVLEIDWDEQAAKLHAYSHKHRFTRRWAVSYDPYADPTPIRNALRQYVDDDDVQALYQIPAQAILQYCGYGPFKTSYIMEGPSNGGKSTFLVFIERLFGAMAIANQSLQKIGNDRFVTSALVGKVVNRYDDLDDIPLEQVGPFKALTGSFEHDVEVKFKSPYQGRITCVHVFATNNPPKIPDRIVWDAAFWSRWIYLRFNNVFEIDPTFVRRTFTPENMSGALISILSLAFEIYLQQGLVYMQDPGQVKDRWQAATNPFVEFRDDNMRSTGEVKSFDKGTLYKAFLAWCGAANISPQKVPGTISGFTQLIYGAGFTTTRKTRSKGDRSWQYEARYEWKHGCEPKDTGGLV